MNAKLPTTLRGAPAAAGVLLACIGASAHAQLVAVGPSVSIQPPAGVTTVRWPAIAYDDGDDTFLAVSGASNIQGQYLAGDGSLLGSAFVVNSDTVYDQAPRVAFSANAGAWLVTWHATVSTTATEVRGRLLRQNQAPLTADFAISPPGSNWEMGAATAWSSHANQFLVAWQVFSTTQIDAQLVTEAGALSGPVTAIDGTASYERDPAVAYDPDDDVFLVAYMACPANSTCFARALPMSSAGAPIGSPITLDGPFTGGYIPEIAYDATDRTFLVVWYRNAGGQAGLYGRTVSASGSLGTVSSVTTTYGSYDANSIAWNATSDTFVFVTHSTTTQDVAIELDATGAPLNPSGVLFEPATASGNFNPRIAARKGAAEWVAVAATSFASLSTQRLSSTPVTSDAGSTGGTDAGSGSTVDAGSAFDAGQPTDSGTAIDAGASQGGQDAGGDVQLAGGCACGSAPGYPWLLVLAALAALRRRLNQGNSRTIASKA